MPRWRRPGIAGAVLVPAAIVAIVALLFAAAAAASGRHNRSPRADAEGTVAAPTAAGPGSPPLTGRAGGGRSASADPGGTRAGGTVPGTTVPGTTASATTGPPSTPRTPTTHPPQQQQTPARSSHARKSTAVTPWPTPPPGPTGCPAPRHGVGYDAPGSGKTVALTFDDGPGRDTARIMAILQRARVPATFFNLGVNEVARPGVVRAEHAAGFVIGDHTWDHRSLTGLSPTGQADEIDRERTEQRLLTGAYPCLLRPPYGNFDATTERLTRERDMSVWYWSVDPEDWKADGSGAEYWIRRITARAEAGAAQAHPVILMHNQPIGNPATVAALPAIISFYRAHGYRFVDLASHGTPTHHPHTSGTHKPHS